MKPVRVLVTGATGFIGGHLARSLASIGHDVTGTGRDTARGLTLQADGVTFRPIDLMDRSALDRALSKTEVVVHCAALSTAWAARRDYFQANVMGTRNLLAASAGAVSRFIHVSTPAVLSAHSDQFALHEDTPLPDTYTSVYGETKALAERLVSEEAGMETVIVRPKAVYGPGDRALLPRVVKAAETGRLAVIGDGSTLTHLTHVDDVSRVLTALVEAEIAEGIFHVAGPEVNLWEQIRRLLESLSLPRPSRSIPVDRALRLGRTLENTWRLLNLRGEPPLTCYTAAVLGFSQTLDTTRTRKLIDFEPITPENGIESVLSPTETRDRTPTIAGWPTPHDDVDLRVVDTGSVTPLRLVIGRLGRNRIELPVRVAAVTTRAGRALLFDTGYGSVTGGSGPLARAYRWLIRPQSKPLVETLDANAIDPSEIDLVVLSHLDPDHVGGLRELHEADVVIDVSGWDSHRQGHGPFWRRWAAAELPDDIAARVVLVDTRVGPVDLLGDASVFLVSLPGHAPGHIGLLGRTRPDTQFLLAGDSPLSVRRLPKLGPYLLIASNRSAAADSAQSVAEFSEGTRRLVVTSHDPNPVKVPNPLGIWS